MNLPRMLLSLIVGVVVTVVITALFGLDPVASFCVGVICGATAIARGAKG